MYSHEWGIHQPHLPHHSASGVLPRWFKQLFINNLTLSIMDNQLIFRNTQTVEQFKVSQHVDKILVKKNPKNNKTFFTYGAKTGAVAVKGIPAHPMISEVETPDGEVFFLLHEEGTGGAPVLATF